MTRRIAALLAILVLSLTACGGTPADESDAAEGASTAPASGDREDGATASADASRDGDEGDASGADGDPAAGRSEPLEQQLPAEVNGVALTHRIRDATGPTNGGPRVAEEFLARIEAIGGSRDSVQLSLSYDASGELDVSIIGLRAPGADAEAFRAEFLSNIDDESEEPVEERSVGGRDVVVAETEPGTAYLLISGDTVFQVFADEDVAAAALMALP